MHSLLINLKSTDGLRLTIHCNSNIRNTVAENEIREQVQNDVNNDRDHSRYGYWKVVSSNWAT